MFVRNVIVGVPALAGAAAFSHTAHAFTAGPAAGAFGITPGVDRVLRQMAALHNDLRLRRPTAADARVAAGYLRELITVRQESGRDAELSRVFRELVATHGRQRLIAAEPSRAVMQQALVSYGVHATAAIGVAAPSFDAREAALERLVRTGATFYYVDPLVLLETYSAIIAENPSFCEVLEELKEILEAMSGLLCLAAQFFPLVAPECVVAAVALAFVQLLDIIYRC